MLILILGLILFFIPHSVSIVNEPWRDRMVARLGLQRWQSIYSVMALAGFVLIIWGYGLARQTPVVVYEPPVELRHLTMLLMLPVFPLLIAAYAPGKIRDITKHPMLLATMLWGAAHLLANGTLHDVILFGSFLIWAAADRLSMAYRIPRTVPGFPPSRFNDLIAIAVGLGLYVAFVAGVHGWLIGVPLVR